MWKKERDALYYSSKNSGVKGWGVKGRGVKGRGVKGRGVKGRGVKSRTPYNKISMKRSYNDDGTIIMMELYEILIAPSKKINNEEI